MQNKFIGFAGVLLISSVMGVVGCGEPAGSGGAGGTGPGSGGSSGAGVGGGGSSSGGSSSGGSSSGGSAGSSSSSGGSAGTSNGGSGGGMSASSCTMDNGGTEVTSLCGNAPLNTLTPTEGMKLCTDTGAHFVSAISTANRCKFSAVINAASTSPPTEEVLRQNCSDLESDCIADPTSVGSDPICGDIPPECAATVAQYSACIADEATLFDQGASELFGCDELTFANLNSAYDVSNNAVDNAAGCMALKATCPTFFPPQVY